MYSSYRMLQLSAEEKEWQKQIRNRAQQAYQRNRPEQLPFLTLREQLIVAQSIQEHVMFDGGFEDAQRKRAIIGTYAQQADIVLLEATYNNRFYTLGHRDVLGALMSHGVDREQFGDIRIFENRIQLVCTKTMSHYIQQQFTHIHKVPVIFQLQQFEQALENNEQIVEQELIVPSFRLDAIVAELLSCSRKHAQQQIQGQLVQCNYQFMTKNDFECQIGDMITIRRFGRVKLLEHRSITRKGNLVLCVGRYQDRK